MESPLIAPMSIGKDDFISYQRSGTSELFGMRMYDDESTLGPSVADTAFSEWKKFRADDESQSHYEILPRPVKSKPYVKLGDQFEGNISDNSRPVDNSKPIDSKPYLVLQDTFDDNDFKTSQPVADSPSPPSAPKKNGKLMNMKKRMKVFGGVKKSKKKHSDVVQTVLPLSVEDDQENLIERPKSSDEDATKTIEDTNTIDNNGCIEQVYSTEDDRTQLIQRLDSAKKNEDQIEDIETKLMERIDSTPKVENRRRSLLERAGLSSSKAPRPPTDNKGSFNQSTSDCRINMSKEKFEALKPTQSEEDVKAKKTKKVALRYLRAITKPILPTKPTNRIEIGKTETDNSDFMESRSESPNGRFHLDIKQAEVDPASPVSSITCRTDIMLTSRLLDMGKKPLLMNHNSDPSLNTEKTSSTYIVPKNHGDPYKKQDNSNAFGLSIKEAASGEETCGSNPLGPSKSTEDTTESYSNSSSDSQSLTEGTVSPRLDQNCHGVEQLLRLNTRRANCVTFLETKNQNFTETFESDPSNKKTPLETNGVHNNSSPTQGSSWNDDPPYEGSKKKMTSSEPQSVSHASHQTTSPENCQDLLSPLATCNDPEAPWTTKEATVGENMFALFSMVRDALHSDTALYVRQRVADCIAPQIPTSPPTNATSKFATPAYRKHTSFSHGKTSVKVHLGKSKSIAERRLNFSTPLKSTESSAEQEKITTGEKPYAFQYGELANQDVPQGIHPSSIIPRTVSSLSEVESKLTIQREEANKIDTLAVLSSLGSSVRSQFTWSELSPYSRASSVASSVGSPYSRASRASEVDISVMSSVVGDPLSPLQEDDSASHGSI
eukprot:scaffold6794_cov46-Attheya_sp.AAC.7